MKLTAAVTGACLLLASCGSSDGTTSDGTTSDGTTSDGTTSDGTTSDGTARASSRSTDIAVEATSPATEDSVPTESVPTESVSTESMAVESVSTDAEPTPVPASTPPVTEASPPSTPTSFTAEVWADNWFALYVNGELVGEDSVPITTERSFNAETFSFEATYPLTIAIEAKDFKETDSGIEYIGEGNQQMGDGGLIAQITDAATGAVVSTDSTWSSLVIHRAPLNTGCERDPDPDTTCQFEATEAPSGWTEPGFEATDWPPATEWSAADVAPKDGYDEINWNEAATLIWGTDLEVDNTVLFRTTAAAPDASTG